MGVVGVVWFVAAEEAVDWGEGAEGVACVDGYGYWICSGCG